MVEADRDCSEVLTQIAAVKAAVNSIGRAVLKEHISHCIVEAVQSGDEQARTSSPSRTRNSTQKKLDIAAAIFVR